MQKDSVRSVEVTPEQFEKQVKTWLEGLSKNLKKFSVTHLKKVKGYGGEYELDCVAEFEVLDGASIIVLVECKHYKNSVKRDVVMLLEAKIRDAGSHKGIVFTTSNFQRGALEYAKIHGIATAIFQDGQAAYETKSLDSINMPPPWYPHYNFIAQIVNINENGNESYHLVKDDYLDALEEWL